MMERWIEPVTLEGQFVTLEPLAREHVAALQDVARDGELWRLWFAMVPPPEEVASYVDRALDARTKTGELTFVVRHRGSGEVVGSTRYCNIDEANHRLEIGYTWYAKRVQRTAVNTECKLLLLSHAFEALGAMAVEFRTHWHNHASRTAITRLGAKQDGVLRNHRRLADGSYRDTVVFSIIESEWPAVRNGLEFERDRPRP